MINDANINYRMSLHILKMLKEKNLITEDEFAAIDNENKKSFKALEL